MELELGLKITQTRHDITSTAKFQLSKDPFGPVFTSRETETMFILTAHLKGYRRESVGIKINEDGTQISISGEKPIQEMVMLEWTMQKQEVELRGFIKVFQIPSSVVLDRIKAKFRDEESILTISLPKSKKGICGVGIVEVKEEEVVDKGRHTNKITKIASNDDDKVPERVETKEEQQPEINKDANKEGLETVKSVAEDLPKKEEHVEETTMAEKIEEPKIEKKKEHDQVDSGELEAMEIETDKVAQAQEPKVESIEEIDQNVAEASEAVETEHQAEKATPKADIEEAIEVPEKEEAEKVVNGLEMSKETGQIQKQTSSEETGVNLPSKQATQLEETKAVDGIHEDLQNQEAQITLQADHDVPEEEEGETSQPADKKDKDKVTETDRSDNQTQEISEEKDAHEGEEEKNDSAEEGTKKDIIEGETRERKPGSRRFKLCRPCAIAGSALLVSLVVIVIHWIRSRKR